MLKLIKATIIVLISISLLVSCSQQKTTNTASFKATSNPAGITEIDTSTSQTKVSTYVKVSVAYDNEDDNSTWTDAGASKITLNGDSVLLDGCGAVVEGSRITIKSAGTFIISGKLTNGQIIVDTTDTAVVKLVLNGVEITSTASSPVYIKNSSKTIIILADGSNNQISDVNSYNVDASDTNNPDATIFSKSNLTINGTGSLTVNAMYKDAITCKDELKITGAKLTINSVADGIKGKDYVAIKNADITVNAKCDGIKSTNEEDPAKGFVYIEGNKINITSQEDAIQAETNILINNGNITITSGGGSSKALKNGSTSSSKGLKAVIDITINGGTFTIDSADDSVHSNNSLVINSGNFTISSGDDGLHSDTNLAINNGDINIIKCYEGIESSSVTINDGNIHLTSNDDGINISSGDSTAADQQPGRNNSSTSSNNNNLYINGGYVVVNANGDGLDANGSITITKGVIIVNGPTANDNGALDCDGTFKMTGGFLVAAGSAGMAEAPDTVSTQNSLIMAFTTTLASNTITHIESDNGEEILTFAPTKQYQTIVVSSPELVKGYTYNIYYGGSASGNEKDGLYSGASYSNGTKFNSFTISDVLTTIGTIRSGGPGGGNFPGGGRP